MDTFIDIETLQCEDLETLALFHQQAKAPANLVDPEKIRMARLKDYLKTVEATSLNGSYGTIACISWSVLSFTTIKTVDVVSCGSEYSMLCKFTDMLRDDLSYKNTDRPPWFIGHNVGFDLRFLWRRLKIHKVFTPFKIPYNAAPWNNKYADTMFLWCGAQEYIKLKELCRILGVSSGEDIDGADVYKEWKAGNHDAVIRHCEEDVARVMEIYKRIG